MRRAWLGIALATATLAQQEPPFTLEQILSSPFPTELTAAPAGGRVAWVLNDRGVRNIWVAETPGYEGRPVTRNAEDDGQEISQLQWTPDGLHILYVRGGDPNRDGEHPNPLSSPEGAEQAIWIVPAAGGEPRRLGEGHSPATSPKGEGVTFLRRHQVWRGSLEEGAEAEQLFRVRGRCLTPRWSPDGTMLAFVSQRGEHSFVGVYDLTGKTVRYLDPGVDHDSNPAWSPDGRRVAFLRIPNARILSLFGARRNAEPWSIRVAEAASGRGGEVWRAKEGTGSVFRGVVAENQVMWASGDRLVFPWEREGWTHLYSVPAAGGDATLLTPGEFEVEHVSLSASQREVLFSSNQDDIDRRHIWRVSVGEGPPRQVTRGDGIEWSPVETSDGKAVAFLRSDARRPAAAAVLAGTSAARDLAPGAIPRDFPAKALAEPQPVVFSAADGMLIRAHLFLPRDFKPGERRPAVIFLHGGSRRQMLLGWHHMLYYHHAYALNQLLATRGYLVLSMNFRSGTGYGMEFREALNYGATGASEFQDVVGAGLYLKSRPDVDPERIGLWGGSYGGYLTAMGLARASEMFAAGVDIHGVHDWRTETRVFAAGDDPETQQRALRIAFESSPMAWVDGWRSPVLLIHGDDDRNVEFRQTIQLVEALRRQGVEYEQLVFPDEVHSFLRHARWLEAYEATVRFFAARLHSGR